MRARPEGIPDTAGVVEVDFAGLGHLVTTVRGLAAELAGNDDLCGHVNDPDLADAFLRVDRNWHKQRVTLQTFLDMAANSVAATLAAYQHLETDLAQASQAAR